MKNLQNATEIQSMIVSAEMVLVYFSGTSCRACELIRKKIENLLVAYPKIESGFINAEEHLELTGIYQIYSVPQFFVYFQGKEILHEGKFFDFRELLAKLDRFYGMLDS